MRVLTIRHALCTLSVLAVASFTSGAIAQDNTLSPINKPISGAGTLQTNTVSAPRPKTMPGTIVVPASSIQNGADLGKKVHTNLIAVNPATVNPLEAPPYGGYAYETPSSIGCVYKLVSTLASGCNPNTTTAVISGGSGAIAIVDAYDDPEAAADLAYFSDQFGIPFSIPKFQVVYADGFQPDIDYSGGWELEESLDIEWAHAMAPSAMLYLVEASSNSYSDLFTAVTVATNLVQCAQYSTTPGFCTTVSGKGEVSMSWGGGEFTGQTAYDASFAQKNVVFFASTGDSPGTIYPSTSQNVVAVGGTSISRSLTNGNFAAEIVWSDAGSGLSSIEARPSYQGSTAVAAIVGTHRGVPDISADANPYTGVWVYDTMPDDFSFATSGWEIVGGTSVASPVVAGIINNAAGTTGFAANTNAELTRIYGSLGTANLKDITSGFCYFYMGYHAVTGYDLCTGVGTPYGLAGK